MTTTTRKTSPLIVLLILLAMGWTIRADFKELQAINRTYVEARR